MSTTKVATKKPNRRAVFGAIFGLIVVIALFNLGDNDKMEESDKANLAAEPTQENDPMNLGYETVEGLVNNPIPYDKWPQWGRPETLSGSDNDYWVVYLETANISFVSDKSDDTILYAGFGRQAAIDHREQIKEERQEILGKHFNAWDGSHLTLTRLIKSVLYDPDSYEHVKTVYWDEKDHLIVQTQYRAKNAFGGLVPGRVKVRASLDGEILEILEEE